MRIPGGDLAPARRRRYGGGYGRRRRRGRVLAVLAVLVLVGGGAGYYLRQDDAKVPQRLAISPTPCATTAPTTVPTTPPPSRAVVLPAPATVAVTVLNGTNRQLLAKRVADLLAADGFRITRQGNATRGITGKSQVLYGPGANLQARTVSAWVQDSVVIPAPRASRGSVQLVLGSGYKRLSTAAEAAAAGRAPTQPVTTTRPSSCAS